MGRSDVRQAIATYLNEAQIDYVGAVYPARPIILSEQDYETIADMGKNMEQIYVGTHGTGRRATVEAATSAFAV